MANETSCSIGFIHAACIVYTFIVWGFWCGLFSIILPIFPIIDIVRYLITIAPWLQH